ncbi:MAG: hypothetical protein ACYDGN_09510 [Acidimicrobiales bacterium]
MSGRRRRDGPEAHDDMDAPHNEWRLWDHIGVISGIVLGLIALGILLLLAAAGDPGAFGILVVTIVGVGLIYFGGQIHGRRR